MALKGGGIAKLSKGNLPVLEKDLGPFANFVHVSFGVGSDRKLSPAMGAGIGRDLAAGQDVPESIQCAFGLLRHTRV